MNHPTALVTLEELHCLLGWAPLPGESEAAMQEPALAIRVIGQSGGSFTPSSPSRNLQATSA